VDCGFSTAEIERRLARLAVAPDRIDAILVTHEHSDHVAGVARFAAAHRIPVRASAGTAASPALAGCALPFDSHAPFAIGDLEVTPLIVPHDACEPTQFVLGDGARRIAVLTDAGHVTPYLLAALREIEALILEANHDETLLAAGPYPASLKRRVGGDYGHLSNAQAADLLGALAPGKLQQLALAHLSEQNNRPELARAAASTALGCTPDWIAIADQDGGLGWREVN
ncbi:MAG TPA: MBL fold metallo-hydrolase, partial [Gammaproteobacteria bacterium]|nr:MBL fold metallo-hydrolase [Gammaproteobacteria bacterium]